ncbi:MAG TPA: hypothetical protein VGR57_14935 [Ktedonobacterales bacterium]|nr:hypothetical protein [Ktedonobacterales bacterium]
MRPGMRARALLAVLCLACLALLAACGSGVSPVGSAPTRTPTPGGTSVGCPSQLIPVDPLPAPDVVLTQQSDPGSNVKTVRVSVGQSIEIRLPAAFAWRLAHAPDAVLTMASPAGWYNANLRACVWRFAAASAGMVHLDFAGAIVCDPGKICPALAAAAQYQITVA